MADLHRALRRLPRRPCFEQADEPLRRPGQPPEWAARRRLRAAVHDREDLPQLRLVA